MKEGEFIDSFDNQAVKHKHIISTKTSITTTCLFCFNYGTLHFSAQTFGDFRLQFIFFMSLYASSYVVYYMTATNFNRIGVFC